MKLNVGPNFSAVYLTDSGRLHSINLGDFHLRQVSGFCKLSYFNNCLFGQKAVRMFFANALAIFINHVLLVFCPSAKKQMVWSYTKRSIAPVANEKSIRYCSVVDNPTKPSDSYLASPAASSLHGTVASATFSSCPNPASLSFCNFGPKSGLNSFRTVKFSKDWVFMNCNWKSASGLASSVDKCIVVLHRSVCLICAALSDAQTSRGQFSFSIK